MALVVNPAPVEHQYHHKNSPKRRESPVQDKFYEGTRNLITACIESASGKEPLSVKLSEEGLRIVGMVQQTLKADEIFFRKLCEELELTATNLFSKLMDVWGGMFSDGQVNLGRLLALLAFCQCVTVYCRSVGLPSIESSVPHWASIFISTTHLKDWITNRGGWVSNLSFGNFHFQKYYYRSFFISPLYVGCNIKRTNVTHISHK